MGNQFLGLSLFVMLLSFFIILNVISSFEETKSRPVLNSLAVTFSTEKTRRVEAPGDAPTPSSIQQEGSTLDKIQALFTAQISSVKAKQNRLGTVMTLTLSFEEFRTALDMTLSPPENPSLADVLKNRDRIDLTPMLVSLMETQKNLTYTMDMLLYTELSPSSLVSKNPEKFLRLSRDIAAIAERLEEAGLPKKQVTAGLKKGEAGMVELVFRRYIPFSPVRADRLHDVGENAERKAL